MSSPRVPFFTKICCCDAPWPPMLYEVRHEHSLALVARNRLIDFEAFTEPRAQANRFCDEDRSYAGSVNHRSRASGIFLSIKEVFLQVAIYRGIPAGIDSFRAAKEVFKEMGI
jgi:hypothetical protein